MQRFIALPTSGDAFLLQRGNVTILVDSGFKKDNLAKLLSKHVPELNRINIAVCTHADRDHAGGFTTLLDQWKPTGNEVCAPIDQLWLPGSWAGIVSQLFLEARKFSDILLKEMEEFDARHQDLNSPEDIEVILREVDESVDRRFGDLWPDEGYFDEDLDSFDELDIDAEELNGFSEPEWMGEFRNRATEIIENEAGAVRAIQSVKRRVGYRVRRGHVSKAVGRYWLGLIDTADIIRQIAFSAIKHHVKIRWFDFGEFEKNGRPQGGIRGLLRPVNAVEQIQPPSVVAFSHLLRLTTQNKQCLSFYSPESYSSSGILFCGDSPMGYGSGYVQPFRLPRMASIHPVIVTAPHHGAESNAIAYHHIQRWMALERIFWVRSGGKSNHPGSTFRNLPVEYRSCTWCPHKNLSRSSVEIIQRQWYWYPTIMHIGHRCLC